MRGFRAKLDYWLKHNYGLNVVFVFCVSIIMKLWGFFVKTDENLILFSGHTRKYNDSPKAIYEYMISNEKFSRYKFVWALENPNEVKIPGNPQKVKADSVEYFRKTLKAKYWVTCVNIERGLRYKKKNCIYMNTWHATPVKHMGNAANGRKDYNFSHVDFFCVAGEYEKKIYLKDLLVKEESILKTGLPRNDVLYHVDGEKIRSIRKKLCIPEEKKVILYAPTWRDSEDGGKTYGLKPPIDVKYWENELGEDYVVLLRTHSYTNELLGVKFNNFIRNYTSYPDVNELLAIADIMISDYSAIIFDYCILERPILCYGYDFDEFAKKRGFYVSLESELPCGVQKTEEELINYIKNINYQEAAKRTKLFKNKYMQYGGQATEMCANILIGE